MTVTRAGRRTARRAAVVLPLTAGLAVAGAAPASAHEAWFVHHPESYPLDWSALASPATLAGIAVAAVLAVVWRVVAQHVPSDLPPLRRLSALVPYVPRLLAAHLGASLLLLSWDGAVLDPGARLSGGGAELLLLVPQVVAGSLLLLGVAVRAAALAVVAAGPVLLSLQGPRALLTGAVIVGVALFLVAVPPRRRDHGRALLDRAHLRPALLALRLGAAVSLLSLAVVEKLANPAMGVAMIEQQPVLNLLSPVGVDAETFVLVAGVVELLFGLLVLSGAAPQVVGLVAAVPFTASLALFGMTELMGHLPVYGVLLVFVVLGSRPSTAAEVSYLPHRGDPVLAR